MRDLFRDVLSSVGRASGRQAVAWGMAAPDEDRAAGAVDRARRIFTEAMDMTFRETLDFHLDAIRGRDLTKLIETLPREELSLITSDGRLVRTTSEFVEMHRGWFAETTWALDAEVVSLEQSPDLGVAVLRLDYRDEPPGRPPVREASYLCLVFARREGRWVMIHDQNTPIRVRDEGRS